MRRIGLVSVAVITVCAAACSSSSSKTKKATAELTVKVVSSRPDMVTGETALLEISGSGAPQVTVEGRDLPVTPVRKWWRVSQLPKGPFTLTARQGSLTGSVQVT